MSSMKTTRNLLPFEVKLTRITPEDNRRLGAIRRWFERRTSEHEPQQRRDETTEDSHRDQITNTEDPQQQHEQQQQQQQRRRRDDSTVVNYDVDPDALQIEIEEYLMEFLLEAFTNSSKADYTEPHQVGLYLLSPPRHRRALSEDTTEGEVDPDGSGRIEMDGIFNSHLSPVGELDLESTSSTPSHDILPYPNHHHYLRQTQKKQLSLYTASYGGAVFFELTEPDKDSTDADESPTGSNLVVPRSNKVHAKQLLAFIDEDGRLLQRLQDFTDPTAGLSSTINVELRVISNVPPVSPAAPGPNTGEQGFDVIIVVAIAVAACSMMLLGFACFLAFRRRKRQREGRSKPVGSPLHKSSKKTSDTSPLSNLMRTDGVDTNAPPVLEMRCDDDHDDNISDYTESVFSMPVQLGAVEKGLACSTGLTRSTSGGTGATPSGGVSTRFCPRYVGGEGMEERSGESSSEGVNELLDGVPPSPQALGDLVVGIGRGGDEGGEEGMMLPVVTPNSKDTKMTTTASFLADSGVGQSAGLYPDHDALIDNDINSSLEAYALNSPFGDLAEVDHHDSLSLSSAETYGFSLDGMNSTVANSTKYGY